VVPSGWPVIRGLATRSWLLGLLFVAPGVAAELEVRIKGVDDELENNVRAFLEITRLQDEDDLFVDRVRRLHGLAPEQIREALEPLGYYKPRVRSRLKGDAGDWTAVYTIDPGEPLTYDRVDIRLLGPGAEDEAFKSGVEAIDLSPGDRVHHGRYEQAKSQMRDIASRRGYFDAAWVETRLRIDVEADEASATLHLDTGPRYTYGDITINQDVLDDKFVRRYLDYGPGDPFHRRDLLDTQIKLGDTEYFENAEVFADRQQAEDGRIPITIDARPRARDRYTWGIGFGTDTGPRMRLGWERRRANRRGHRFEGEAEVSQIRTRVGFAYTIPLKDPANERLVFNSTYKEEEFGDGDAEAIELGLRRTRQFSRWQITEGVMYESSRDEIGGNTDTRQLVVPSLRAEQSKRNDAIYPTQAYRFGAEIRGARESLGSDVDFTQIRVDGRWIQRILPRTRVLVRGEWGGTKVADVDRLPLSQRFFAGGDNSVRGFDFQDLGPRNDDGDVTGGRYLTTGSIELERLLFGDWGAAVFSDVGNVGDQPDLDLEQSVGVGLRWRSPFGMMRLDIAEPISTDGPVRLHLSLGIGL